MKVQKRGKTVLFLTILGLLLTIAPQIPAQQVDTSQRRGPMPPTLNQQPGTTTAPRPEEGYYFEEDLIPPTPTPIPLTFEQMIMQKGSAYGSVKHILAGNLFELENEYRVQLLGVKALSAEQATQGNPTVNEQLFEYAKRTFIDRPLQLRFESIPDLEGFALPVYIVLPDGRILNEELIREGLALFDTGAMISEAMRNRLERAQTISQRRRLGVWQVIEPPQETAEMIQEATPQQDLYTMPPLQVPEVPSLPDTLILITGEEIIGQIEGSPTAKVVTIRTADGNAIAVPQERIEKIERKK